MMPLLKVPFNIGTLTGLAISALSVILYYFAQDNWHPSLQGQLLFFPVSLAGILISILYVKKVLLKGKITFRRAFFTGTVTSFISVSLFCIIMYIFVEFIAHDYIGSFVHQTQKLLEENPDVKAMVHAEDLPKSPGELSAGGITQAFLVNGLFMCLIITSGLSLMLKNQRWRPGMDDWSEANPDQPPAQN